MSAGKGSKCSGKVLGMAGYSIETWNTGYMALMVSRR